MSWQSKKLHSFKKLHNALASNPNLDPELQKLIASNPESTKAHEYLAKNPNSDPEVKKLINSHKAKTSSLTKEMRAAKYGKYL